ncbi:MAG TPA: exodeoxyribonuclease VII large subunit, partial [Kofleriaceae bacterium]
RASTPTAAAELAVPDGAALVELLRKERRRLDREIHHTLDRARQDLDRRTMALHARGERALHATRAQLHQLHHRLAGLHPRTRILGHRSAFSELERRLDRTMREILGHRRSDLARLGAQIAALSPLAVLDRGYAMVRAGDAIVRDVEQVSAGDRLRVRLARGSLDVIVDAICDPEAE